MFLARSQILRLIFGAREPLHTQIENCLLHSKLKR